MKDESQNIIEIKGLSKSFKGNQILEDVDLAIKEGENIAVMGKSGTGKTVLIKCIVGLMKPDKGQVFVFGEDVTKLNHKKLDNVRLNTGFLFQGGALYDSMTVRENLEFPVRRHQSDKSEKEILDMVKKALSDVGLEDAINKMPSELSGGMRKRIGLARTIILQPKIIMYDEPTTGLDPITSREISELINKIKEKYNTTSIVITHDIACAAITAQRIVMFNNCKIAAEGTLEELKKSQDEWVQDFFKA